MEIDYKGKIIIFDLDDTLYPEKDFVLSGFRKVAEDAAAEFSLSADELFQRMAETFKTDINPFDLIADNFLPDNCDKEQTISRWVDIYRHHIPQLSLPQDSKNFLDKLRERGIRVGLITDGRSVTQRNKLSALGLKEYIADENIIISEEFGHDKKSIAPFTHFVRNYPNACSFTYIADNPAKDFYYPNLLGWTTVCIADKGDNVHAQNIDTDELHQPLIKVNRLAQLNL